MSNLILCRVCLAVDRRLHSIANTHLQEVYENLTRTKLTTENGWSVSVCFICLAHLQTSRKLVEIASHSDKMLLEIYHNHVEISQDTTLLLDRIVQNYSVTPIESISLVYSNETCHMKEPLERDPVKHEPTNIENKIVQTELDDPAMNMEVDHITSSDPEDDVPLNSFKTTIIQRKVKIKNIKRQYHKGVKIDAQEILLTKEQQMASVQARATSLNYLQSPYKCHLCFKGFANPATYRNHSQKHDESSGAHQCEVCLWRYRAPHQLRAHVASAHARRYTCNQCGHVSHTVNQAKDHEKWHEGFMFECQLCSQKFTKRTSYLTHSRKNHPTESVCTECGLGFVGQNGLILHTSKTHRTTTQVETGVPAAQRYCADCDVQFVCLEAYQRHLVSSLRHPNDENCTQCVVCKKDHPDHASLIAHIKAHKRELLQPSPVVGVDKSTVQLACHVCAVTFSSRSRLAAHVARSHLGRKYVKHVVCEHCGQQFKSLATLTYHQRRHSGARPHACAVCGARFSLAGALRVHARVHSGERPYACRVCDKRFTQKPALNRHLRVHTGAKPYVCQVCAKCFSQSNSLKVHVQTVHLKMSCRKRCKKKDEITDN